ncbi:MAG TPA: MBL fold metallo-hydrolase [candidate division Zixibacteria bacterium]|nr:MBL fold metallo-hydrolase [candidate division Zixibacteria bacterium]
MRLTILGRSPARPNPGEACAGYLVEGGGSRILLDVGPGVVAQLLRRNTPDELDAVVISHMHTDHCLDLVTLRYSYPWVDVARKRLKVIVPPGATAQLTELALGAGYADFFDKSFTFVEHDGTSPIEIGNLRLEPERTQHYVPTWGFRITARGPEEDSGRVLGYSADAGPCDALPRIADRAEIFLCEAALRSLAEDDSARESRGHLLPGEAASVAAAAGSRRLILTHIPLQDGGEWALREARAVYSGALEIAEPQRTYEV